LRSEIAIIDPSEAPRSQRRSRASENRTRDIEAQGGHAQGGEQTYAAKQHHDVEGANIRLRLFGRGLQNRCDDRIHGCSPSFHSIHLTTDSFQRDFVPAMKRLLRNSDPAVLGQFDRGSPTTRRSLIASQMLPAVVAGKRRRQKPLYLLTNLKTDACLHMCRAIAGFERGEWERMLRVCLPAAAGRGPPQFPKTRK
jgi:hypothetical protein